MWIWRSPPLLATLIIVVALGTLGFTYGMWSETLLINGTVQTGELNAEWTFVGCFDIEKKDVGEARGFIDEKDPQLLHFQIDNGYPSYTGDCEVEYMYTGDVPVHVEAINFVAGSGLTNCDVDYNPRTGSFTATCDQLEVKWVYAGLCQQLHTGDGGAASLRVHVEQAAQMSSTYDFGVEMVLVQFNESECP